MIIHTAMLLGNSQSGWGLRGNGKKRQQGWMFSLCVFVVALGILSGGAVWAEDGVGLFQKGQFDEARVAFELMIKKNADDPVALYYLGRLTPSSVASRRYFQRVVEQHPQHDLADDALFELVEVDFVQGLYVTARNKYRQLLQTYPKTNKAGMIHYRIGLTFLAVRQADSALVFFDAVRDFSSDVQAMSHAQLGRLEAWLQQGKEADVVREAKAWLAVGAGDFDADVREIIRAISPEDVPVVEQPKPVGHFWVQVAAFKNEVGARSVQAKLEDVGYEVELGSKKNSQWIFVFVGPYPSETSAKSQIKRIDQLVHVKSNVIER